jgi:hypothetical protein
MRELTANDKEAYEAYINQRALINAFNRKAIMGLEGQSYTDMVLDMIEEFSQLKGRYPILSQFTIPNIKTGERVLTLNDKAMLKDPQLAEIYFENLKDLADENVKKVTDPTDNKRISKLFGLLPIMSMYQHGIGYSKYGFNEALPYEGFIGVMDTASEIFMKSQLNNDTLGNIFELMLDSPNRDFTNFVRDPKTYIAPKPVAQPVEEEVIMDANTPMVEDMLAMAQSAEEETTQPTVEPVEEITISPEDITFKSNKLETFERMVGLEPVKGYGLVIKNQPNVDLFTFKDKEGWRIIDNVSKKLLPLRDFLSGATSTKNEITEGLSNTLNYYVKQEQSRKILEEIGFNFISRTTQPSENKSFTNSLFRGQEDEPIINENGDLVILATYDSLFKSTGSSFAKSYDMAQGYGARYSKNPYVIEINKDYADKISPLIEGGTKSYGNRVVGDQGEERFISENNIIIPKGMFTIHRTDRTFNTNTYSAKQLIEGYNKQFIEDDIAEYNRYGEASQGYAKEGSDYYEAIENELLKRGISKNDFVFLQQPNPIYSLKEIVAGVFNIQPKPGELEPTVNQNLIDQYLYKQKEFLNKLEKFTIQPSTDTPITGTITNKNTPEGLPGIDRTSTDCQG